MNIHLVIKIIFLKIHWVKNSKEHIRMLIAKKSTKFEKKMFTKALAPLFSTNLVKIKLI